MKTMSNNDQGLMDMDDASKYLCIKKSSLYQICMRKQITVIKIGMLNRFRKLDLDAFINKNTREAEISL
jgi:excisionase family DNA binding protein